MNPPPQTPSETSSPRGAHSLWPAVGLGLGVAIGNGFARFSYALLLPAMRDDLRWTYAQAGWMSTANALGYIAGAVTGYLLLRRHRPSQLFISGSLLTVLSLWLTGLGSGFAWLTALRLASGVGAAWVFACGGALVTARYQASVALRGTATGIYFAGAGIGIAVSGLLVNPVLAVLSSGGWPWAWAALGAAAAVASIWPVLEARRISGTANSTAKGPLDLTGLYPSLTSYFLFACGYIVYMTFLFAWIRTQHMSLAFGTLVWVVLGAGVVVSPFAWRRALDAWNPTVTLAASCAVTLAGVVVVVISATGVGVVISAVLFGVGMFIVPSAIVLLARRTMAPAQWAPMLTWFTIIFAVGQAIGPTLAGAIADRATLDASLGFGAAVLAASALAAWLGRGRVAARMARTSGGS